MQLCGSFSMLFWISPRISSEWCFFSMCVHVCVHVWHSRFFFPPLHLTHPAPFLSFLLLMVQTGASVHVIQLETLLTSSCLCFWQRSTSLEVSATAHDCVSDAQSNGLNSTSVCTRRKRRSQSIPAELAAPSSSPYAERPPGCNHSLDAGAVNKVTLHQSAVTHVNHRDTCCLAQQEMIAVHICFVHMWLSSKRNTYNRSKMIKKIKYSYIY